MATVEDRRVTRSKKAILDAAVELITEHGVRAVTVEAICQRSGVAKTTLYRHWTDRQSVLVDAVQTQLPKPVDPNTGSFQGDLEAMATGLARGLSDPTWAAMLISLIDAAQHDNEFVELHHRVIQSRHQTVQAIVDRAVARGEITSQVDREDLIDLTAGALFYRRLVTHRTLSRQDAARIAGLVAGIARGDTERT